MSLLEDVFLENEADEAQELERVIEGDDYDDRPRPTTPNSDENSEKEDEAEEDKTRVDPTKAKEKRVVKNPRLILNPARLTGPRGIQIIPDHFKDFKFKGKGHEKEDLDLVLKSLEHWAYRLFPKFKFEDCLKKMESLGKKRPVMVHLHKIRSDQYTSEETVVQRESSDEEDIPVVPEEDEFDKLLQQQIELARVTPAPGSVRKGFDRSLLMPKATSSPSISDEQRERMLKNRQRAEERRLARLKQNSSANASVIDTQNKAATELNDLVNEDVVTRKNRSNIIDSSDDECDTNIVNQTITVDIHKGSDKNVNDTIESNDMRKDTEDILIVEDTNIACQGDIELGPTKNNSVAEVEDNTQIVLEDGDVACQGDIELDLAGNEDGNGTVEVKDNHMDIPIESTCSQNSKVKGLIKETELAVDTVLEDINDSNTGKDAKQIPENDMVMKTNDNTNKNETLNKSLEKADVDEINNGNDDFDIMDVDFSEEF